MIRSGAVLVALSLLALLGAIVVHDGQGASWLIATSVALCVAGVSLMVVAPWPTTRRPLRVQLVHDDTDDADRARAELATELLAALDAAHADDRAHRR